MKGKRDCTSLLIEEEKPKWHLLPQTLERPGCSWPCRHCGKLASKVRVLEVRGDYRAVCLPCLEALQQSFMKGQITEGKADEEAT